MTGDTLLTGSWLEYLPLNDPWFSGAGLLILALALLFFSAFSALLERSGHIRLRHWSEEAGGNLRQLHDEPNRFEAFRFILSLLAGVMPVLLLSWTWITLVALDLFSSYWLIAPFLVILWMVLGEWGNRALVERYSERALSLSTTPLRLLYRLTSPLVWVFSHFIAIDDPDHEDNDDEDEASDEEIDAYIDVGLRDGILEPEEERLVRGIVDFGDTQVRSVMTPRVEMVSASLDISLEELSKIFFESKRSRVPVYTGSVDQVIGILHIRDLFEAMHRKGAPDIQELLKPPYYVPESKVLLELLEELQRLHQTMAIVVDEYGGVSGLVTVEDLVEEIVGEINDEHETTGLYPVVLDDQRWRFHGRSHIEELAEKMDLDLDLDELPYETVSGLICGELGYVPRTGEEVTLHDLAFVIEGADERRVVEVIVRPTPGREREDA